MQSPASDATDAAFIVPAAVAVSAAGEELGDADTTDFPEVNRERLSRAVKLSLLPPIPLPDIALVFFFCRNATRTKQQLSVTTSAEITSDQRNLQPALAGSFGTPI